MRKLYVILNSRDYSCDVSSLPHSALRGKGDDLREKSIRRIVVGFDGSAAC